MQLILLGTICSHLFHRPREAHDKPGKGDQIAEGHLGARVILAVCSRQPYNAISRTLTVKPCCFSSVSYLGDDDDQSKRDKTEKKESKKEQKGNKEDVNVAEFGKAKKKKKRTNGV